MSSENKEEPKPAAELTADDLVRIFNDPKGELLNYRFDMKVMPDAPAAKSFVMDVPYDAIKAMVNDVEKQFWANFDSEAPKPAFEHAGSTSIKGMPGSVSPDVLVIEEKFPPSASTVKAIVACGFKFKSIAPHGNNDYFFMKSIPADDIGPDRMFAIHLIEKTDPTGRVILRLRDACNNDPAAFEEYKASKIAASKGTSLEYKIGKQAGLIHRLRKEEGLPVQDWKI